MIGFSYTFIQIKKTVIFKAVRVILAQVESYYFVKTLSSVTGWFLHLFPGATSSPQSLTHCPGLTLTLSQHLMLYPF